MKTIYLDNNTRAVPLNVDDLYYLEKRKRFVFWSVLCDIAGEPYLLTLGRAQDLYLTLTYPIVTIEKTV